MGFSAISLYRVVLMFWSSFLVSVMVTSLIFLVSSSFFPSSVSKLLMTHLHLLTRIVSWRAAREIKHPMKP